MKKLFNDGWEFSKQKSGTGIESLQSMDFTPVNIPHDWLIGQTKDLYEDSEGIYRKRFSLKKEAGRRYEIYFEGAYMDSTLYVNGKEAGSWKYGYSSFFFDITSLLIDGRNELVLKLSFRSPNSRWYSGAGIFRDVFFTEFAETHVVTDSLCVSTKQLSDETDGEWELTVSAEIAKGAADCRWNKGFPESSAPDEDGELLLSVPEAGIESRVSLRDAVKERLSDGVLRVELTERVRAPRLWAPETPELYACSLALCGPGQKPEEDAAGCRFGFRSFRYDTEKGLFVNGVHTKIRGVCEHHDLGAIGAAFNREAMRRKYLILREMGVNAIRTAHNMPATGLLDLADELGFLVMDEAFDMWESSKTEFDYGRFFKEWQERDVRSWIRRDRNHPSIVLWSIGNEIYDTHKDEHGQEITRMLQEEALANDPRGNAAVTMGSNYMPWENTQKCADILKYIGYNYAERFYDEHHAAHPDWYIFGSETGSTVQSRGIYHFPYSRALLADDDLECSSLGNSTTSWGAPNPEHCVIQERDHDFSMGQFLWSGFDYIGEPTPYQTRNSYFGQIDTAGFPKDSFYVYKAAWTKEPFVHLFPYWDFNPGQLIDVRALSNAPELELFVNGKSLGRQQIDHAHGTVLSGNWQVEYEPGEITAVAYDAEGNEVARQSRHSFGEAVKLCAEWFFPERELTAGNGDMAFISVWAEDAEGHPVENATNAVRVEVEGAGWLAGLDNGDSADADEYKGHVKRLFSGKMLVCVAVEAGCGEIRVKLESAGLEGVSLSRTVSRKEEIPGISLLPERLSDEGDESRRVRKIELTCEGSRMFGPERKEAVVTARILPADAESGAAAEELIWKAVNDDGIESNVAKITARDGYRVTIAALGDGDFRLRCMTKCGCECVRVISELDFHAEGLGTATLDPYHFVAGGLWSYGEGDIGVGNDHGVSTERGARSVVGFENIDFGSYGSDEISLSVFNLSDDPFDFELWEGIPGKEGSELLLNGHYHKKMIWNVYQPETYRLKRRMKGLCGLYLVAHDKVHIGGFSFTEFRKAYERLKAGECDAVYGDSFAKKEDRLERIGNNVTVEFTDMDFGEEGAKQLVIEGQTDKPVNTIHVIFDDGSGEIRDILEFAKDGGREQRFAVGPYRGKGTIRFVFLPGSSFDFYSLRFEK
ncbi:MAG: DUF4982 domain-containing protein [Lachnospiraceae bacterium]|nr:DUF4982 domain-containing protein [Lachnospiraceae bacterium]